MTEARCPNCNWTDDATALAAEASEDLLGEVDRRLAAERRVAALEAEVRGVLGLASVEHEATRTWKTVVWLLSSTFVLVGSAVGLLACDPQRNGVIKDWSALTDRNAFICVALILLTLLCALPAAWRLLDERNWHFQTSRRATWLALIWMAAIIAASIWVLSWVVAGDDGTTMAVFAWVVQAMDFARRVRRLRPSPVAPDESAPGPPAQQLTSGRVKVAFRRIYG